MAQRRSRNRRLSRRSNNASGFLDDNTNIISGSDLQWYNRTILRPSTSFAFTENDSSILNPDSSYINQSETSNNWYNNLSRSNTSKLMEEAVRRNISDRNDVSNDNTHVEPITESESEAESLKKRGRLRQNLRKINNKSDKSNVFLKALEKTTESHTRNSTIQMPEGSESEVTNDDSRTIKRFRPRLFRNVKHSKENSTNFDDILQSDSTSELVKSNTRNSRSSLKRKSKELHDFTSSEVLNKHRRTQLDKVIEADSSSHEKTLNKSSNNTLDKTVPVTPVRELRNRSIVQTSVHKIPNKSSQKHVGSATVYDPVDMSLTMIENNIEKKRTALFSQDKSVAKQNENELQLDSENELNIDTSSEKQENDNVEHQADNESESSSIPKYIRRTRSRSLYAARKSSSESKYDNVFKSQIETPKDKSDQNVSLSSLRDNQSHNSSNNVSKLHDKLINKSNNNLNKITSNTKPIEEKSDTSSSNIIENAKSQQSNSEESSDDENMIDVSRSNSQHVTQTVHQKSAHSQSLSFNTSSRKSKTLPKNVDGQSSNEPLVNKKRISRSPQLNQTPNNPRTSLRSTSKVNLSKSVDNSQANNSENERTKSNSQEEEREDEDEIEEEEKEDEDEQQEEEKEDEEEKEEEEKEDEEDKEEENEQETSTIPNHIRRTRSRIFHRSEIVENNPFDDVFDDENSRVNQSSNKNRSKSQSQKSNLQSHMSQNSNRSPNITAQHETHKSSSRIFKKPQENLQKSASKVSNDSSNESLKENQNINRLQQSRGNKNKLNMLPNSSVEKINKSKQTNVKKSISYKNQTKLSNTTRENAEHENIPQLQSSNDTSGIGTSKIVSTRNRTIPNTAEKSITDDNFSDDLLHTPHPAQSTLNLGGKPVTRITDFFKNSIINECDSPQTSAALNRVSSSPPVNPVILEQAEEPQRQEREGTDEEDNDVDVTNDSDISENPMITRHPNDIPYEAEKSTCEEETATPFFSTEPSTSKLKTRVNDNVSTIDESVWTEMKKKTDALKIIMETQKKQQDVIQRERERKKSLVDAKLKRAMAQREAELKKQRRKPIDKAYYVDGKLYKQPKLPIPKKWVTDRLYKYLWKHMEPKYGLRTRVKSEKFVQKLSNIFTVVVRRKKYENYKEEIDDLLIEMARLNLIKDRYDFYTFCREFMPYSFRSKVVPIREAGDKINIPYDRHLVHKPILQSRNNLNDSESNSDSSNRGNNENNESGSDTY